VIKDFGANENDFKKRKRVWGIVKDFGAYENDFS
jgi:hypothetical protein